MVQMAEIRLRGDWITSHRFPAVNLEIDFLMNGLKYRSENFVLVLAL